jgi:hypothetical protein
MDGVGHGTVSRLAFVRLGPTEPAGKPSFRGRPTGRLILGCAGAVPNKFFFVLPFGRPGRRLTGSEGLLDVAPVEDEEGLARSGRLAMPGTGLSIFMYFGNFKKIRQF